MLECDALEEPMAYMTWDEQIQSHLAFLMGLGLDVQELLVDVSSHDGWVRVRGLGESSGRGDLAYKSTTCRLNNGSLGLGTVCRASGGQWHKHQTRGSACADAPTKTPNLPLVARSSFEDTSTWVAHENAAEKARTFWKHCSMVGDSPYLRKRGVGSYGIRFKTTSDYGTAAVVPMIDLDGKLWNRQFLNADGSKLFAKGGRTKGLFHVLSEFQGGEPIGIAESYVTAATCLELTGVAMVCAFSSGNLCEVATLLRARFPACPLLIFADNDRHLPKNEGVERAKEAYGAVGGAVRLLIPEFGDHPPTRDATDWNDLVRINGHGEAFNQYTKAMSSSPSLATA